MDIISSLGTLASLVGVGLSIWVLRVAKNAKTVLEHHVIVPGLARKIELFLEVISPLLAEPYNGKDDKLHTAMNRCSANLKSLKSHSPKDEVDKIQEVINDIDSIIKLPDYPKVRTNMIRDKIVFIIEANSNFLTDLRILN